MRKWVEKNWPYLLMVIVLLLLCQSCRAQGVLGMEQTIRLPEDGTKWHISVVGTGDQYKELMQWFESDKSLKDLRAQIHFHPISDKTGIEAYKVKGLPTVRLQDDKGRVLYEAFGDSIPATPQGLYGAMARAIKPCPWDDAVDPPDPVSDGGGRPRVEWAFDWRLLIIVAAVVIGFMARFFNRGDE